MDVKQLEYFRAIVDAGTISGGGACSPHDTAAAELSGKDARRRTSGAAFFAGHQKDYINGSRKNTV